MYVEHEEVKNRRWFDTERFLDVHQIKFTGFRCPRPLFKFEHANFPECITNVIKSQESTYTKPTALQCMCWPILLSARDLIAVSNSNYGKHLAYLLPIILHIRRRKESLEQNEKGPFVLLLTPHLPAKDDILSAIKPYIEAAEVNTVFAYENEEKADQVEKLKATNIDFLVANPMRLLELMAENENLISLSNVTFFVVDEYIQFRKTQTMDYVKQVADRLRRDHQTVVFSRLVPSGIQRQGDEFVRNCIFFEMHHDKESANDEIKQVIELCDRYMKASRLVQLVDQLTRHKDCKILIYAKDKEQCLNINFELKRQLDMDVIDFKKEETFVTSSECIMSTFKNIGLEIAIPDLDYIINIDFPPNLQTYMDRLRKGVVHYTLFAREDAKHAERLIYSLKQARQEYDSSLATMSKAWLECARDMRFMPFVEDLKKGISKPLQEMMLSSEDEDTSQSTISTASTSMQSQYSRGKNFDSQADDLEDDEDYEEDDDEDIS